VEHDPLRKPRGRRIVSLLIAAALAGWFGFWMDSALEHRQAATAAYRSAAMHVYASHRQDEEFAVAVAFGVPLILFIAWLSGSYVMDGVRRRPVSPPLPAE
jgi:hypothetical protein